MSNYLEPPSVPVRGWYTLPVSTDVVRAWRRAEARWLLGRADAADLSIAATALLSERSTASSPLARLASATTNDDPRDLGDAVAAVVDELGLQPLRRNEAARVLVDEVAERIVHRETPPEAGARDIWALSESMTEDRRPMEFVALASDWDEHPAERDSIRAGIMDAAQRLVSSVEADD